ncbi:hypothetical protein BDEG_23209 [Batrachochytrium dendrobatidis JEL423]|uniref:Extracellular metalloproteinase n=2 Tax=Batrachochytrium dendrobatidis TaxID=109871 RepID=A0A177WHU5_BATDL|nr:hypothetical protein BDEG_23209 [Batrachochytrium dendrobatidis JEL423]
MLVPIISFVLALITSVIFAAPIIPSIQDASDSLPFYFPQSIYQHIPYEHSSSLIAPSNTDPVKTGVTYLCDQLNISPSEFKVYNSFTDNVGVTHVYGVYMVNDTPVSNHQAAVHIKNDHIISYSTSFGTKSHLAKRELSIAEPKTKLTFEQVADDISKAKGLPVYSEFKHELEYVQQADGTLVYVYKFQLRDADISSWIQVWADVNTGKLVQAVDFGRHATYKVIPLPGLSPDDGFSSVKNPEYKPSSPNGWIDKASTEGNNANTINSFKIPRGPETSVGGVFDTKFNSTADPNNPANMNAAAVNMFYFANLMHDITYQYGFNEAAGNFQNDNFGKGGRGEDAVTIEVLDVASANNAIFFAPVDGIPGKMRMFRYTSSKPHRNPGLDNQVVLHEYGHGISIRLTGGSSTDNCLSRAESNGMGEGWSDIFAMIITAKQSHKADTPIAFGSYAKNSPSGLRSHPYTTDMKVNPLTYADLQTRKLAHDMGEVWAAMLWDIYWNLVTKSGFSTNLYNAKGKFGNVITMQNMIGGMMLQPCNPTFIDARDAFIASDAVHYKGANKCEIWKGFAKRGLGVKAADYTNDFTVPAECSGGTLSSSSAYISKTTEKPFADSKKPIVNFTKEPIVNTIK